MAGCLILATGCGAAAPEAAQKTATPPTPATASPVTSSPTKGPQPVKPVGDTVNTHKIQFEKAAARGRTVKLTWWSGVAPCTVLDHVKVRETGKKVTLTIYEGASPKAKNVACIMIAIQKTTVVKLKAPIGHRKLVDGAKSK